VPDSEMYHPVLATHAECADADGCDKLQTVEGVNVAQVNAAEVVAEQGEEEKQDGYTCQTFALGSPHLQPHLRFYAKHCGIARLQRSTLRNSRRLAARFLGNTRTFCQKEK